MEIAENITWTEELERLDVLLSQGQFELLLPGERYGGGEKEIWLVYLMNDAAESFLVFHDAELTGTYQKEYEGEIDAALEKDGEQYVLIVRQGETVCTLFFSRLSLEVHLFDYGKTGHFWVDGYEYLRQIEFRIAILRDIPRPGHILPAPVFHLGGKVRVAGPGDVPQVGVILRAGVGIPNDGGQRCPAGHAVGQAG